MKVDLDQSSILVRVDSEAETNQLGQALAQLVEPGDVLGLVGTLGSGKTRLVKSLASSLGVDPANVSSPTFVLIHEYEGRGGLPIYHFDTYRLHGPDSFEALGVAEYLSGAGICLVEWADRVPDSLPATTIWIILETLGPESRFITIRGLPEARRTMLRRLLSDPGGATAESPAD